MKLTRPDAVLSRQLLSYVRDTQPTVQDFTDCYGDQTFHVLRTHGVLVVEAERVRLSRRYLSPDKKTFVWGIRVFSLDNDAVHIVRWGPEGALTYSEIA